MLVYVPPEYFILSSDQGPYPPLTGVYAFVFACWVLMATAWIYLTFFLYGQTSVTLCKFISGLPILKALTVMLGVAFWATCNSWLMCSYWLGVALMNIQLIYETSTILVPTAIYLLYRLTVHYINVCRSFC